MSGTRTILVDESYAPQWDAFVSAHPEAALYHTYAWRDIFSRVFRRETFYIAAQGMNGTLDGVLPVARLKSLLFGDFMVSLPYFNYGGALARDAATYEVLYAEAVRLAQSLGVVHLELRHRANRLETFAARLDKVTMVLRLPATVDELRKQLGSKLRAQIKRPERDGATVVLGGAELLDQFHAVLAENMRDLGTPSYPKAFFADVLRIAADAARIALVHLGGKAVAAGLVLRHRDTLEIPWASSLREANRSGVNMLLYGRLIDFAVEQGLRYFDFGRCTVDSGTYRFKRQWGAEPQQLYWHYWLRNGGALPQLNPNNPKYALAVRCWRRLPVPIASWVSARLIGNLP